MIVKIWPIKADYADQPDKVGGVEGLKNALEYICDKEKVIVKRDDLDDVSIMQADDSAGDPEFVDSNTTRVISYMANEDKIDGKYISGYLCNPESAVAEFNMARELVLAKAGEEREKETGAVAFHIVQSFPEGLDISDEEVHQCGMELCERIKVHQAVVCSHVHPVEVEVDDKVEVHGKCKHNHILINAYIHPEKIDPRYPNRLKYNDCKESYALLRQWNDEIAIEHGLPIIRNPDEERTYSWKETDAENHGLSWKERMRMDIESARRLSDNWGEFVAAMKRAGYQIRDGAHQTYTAPDGQHKARGGTLGKQYTKEGLELYWSIRAYSNDAVEEAIKDNEAPPLLAILQNASEDLLVGIPLGSQGQEQRSIYYVSIDKLSSDRATLETYFNSDELYDIYDNEHKAVATATGAELVSSIQQLKEPARTEDRTSVSLEDEYEADRQKKRCYTCYVFINSRTKQPYKTNLYDSNGRRRSTLELLFILAITVLKQEDGLWQANPIPAGHENEVLYADTNWKIQNMVDSMYTAKAEGIETVAQLEHRLNDAGGAYSRAKSALKKTVRAKEKMDPLNQAITEYLKTKDLAEKLDAMPHGREKVELQEKHKDVIQRYKAAKAVMYRYQVTEEHQVNDFLSRYQKIQKDISELEERFDESKETYRKLKKLSYNASLAENAQYCYGPNYTYEHIYQQVELAQKEAQRNQQSPGKQRLDAQIQQRKVEDDRAQPGPDNDIKK